MESKCEEIDLLNLFSEFFHNLVTRPLENLSISYSESFKSLSLSHFPGSALRDYSQQCSGDQNPVRCVQGKAIIRLTVLSLRLQIPLFFQQHWTKKIKCKVSQTSIKRIKHRFLRTESYLSGIFTLFSELVLGYQSIFLGFRNAFLMDFWERRIYLPDIPRFLGWSII